MLAIGADSDNPADGERGGPTLPSLFVRQNSTRLKRMVNKSALFNSFLKIIFQCIENTFCFWEYNSDSVVDSLNCKCNIHMYSPSIVLTIGTVIYVGAESGRGWRCDRVHILHQPGVAGVTLWRSSKHPSFCFSLHLCDIPPSTNDQRLTPCKVIMIALN